MYFLNFGLFQQLCWHVNSGLAAEWLLVCCLVAWGPAKMSLQSQKVLTILPTQRWHYTTPFPTQTRIYFKRLNIYSNPSSPECTLSRNNKNLNRNSACARRKVMEIIKGHHRSIFMCVYVTMHEYFCVCICYNIRLRRMCGFWSRWVTGSTVYMHLHNHSVGVLKEQGPRVQALTHSIRTF